MVGPVDKILIRSRPFTLQDQGISTRPDLETLVRNFKKILNLIFFLLLIIFVFRYFQILPDFESKYQSWYRFEIVDLSLQLWISQTNILKGSHEDIIHL